MENQKHAPTPWDTKPTAGNHQHLIWDESGKTIALVYTDADDAALIITAVNTHDTHLALLAEAREALREITEDADDTGCEGCAVVSNEKLESARAILAKLDEVGK